MKKSISTNLILKYSLFVFFVFNFLCSYCQKRIDSVLDIYSKKYQPERVYFQLNQLAYTLGDVIWFKGYIISGILPSGLSKNMYVDFRDNEGKLLAHLVYPIINGGSFGQFKIPDSLIGNSVYMTGYTVWMKNFDSLYFYNKEIRIVKNNIVPTNPANNKTTLTFFPEGGNLVAGIKNTVAFKANDSHGIPIELSGSIFNSKNEKIVDFVPEHNGMGKFSFIPETNEVYTARGSNGNIQVTLPQIFNSGVALQVKGVGSEKYITINRSSNAPVAQQQIHLLATIEQKVVYLSNINLENKDIFNGKINASSFPAGIMQITVFDNNWVPLAERICFVSNMENKILHPIINLKKNRFTKTR